MEHELHHFEEFNEQIYKIYKEKNLKNLGQLEFNSQEKGSAGFMSGVLRRKINIHPLPYSDFKIHDELDFITKDLKYVTGVLYFLRPYIVDTDYSGGQYHQNLADRRYLMYANFGLQSIYNFWDRIGDLLWIYFETKHKPNKVYFHSMIRDIKEPYISSKEYLQLKEIYDKDLVEFFDLRNEAIHHFQLECKFYWGSIETHNKPAEKEKLNKDKHSLPEKMEKHLELCVKGFELAIRLIDLLPDKFSILLEKQVNSNSIDEFKILELKKLNQTGQHTDIINQFDANNIYTEDKLKDEISAKFSVSKDLVFLIVPSSVNS